MPPQDDDDLLAFLVDSAGLDDADAASELDADLDGHEAAEDDNEAVVPDDLDDVEDVVATALRPGVPLVLLHRSHQHAGVLPAVVADITRRHAGALHLGVVAPMPRMSPAAVQSFFTGAGATVRIADPEGFARDDSFGPTLTAQRADKPYVGPSTQVHWPYFTSQQPPGGSSPWVGMVLDAQRDVGANVLLTPGLWCDPATPAASLATVRQHAVWARSALAADEHLAVNITVPSNWLTNDALRDRLLDEVLDLDEQVFYLRVRWPLMVQPYGQLVDTAILDGYVEVANVLDENDKILLLPNTGLTGWTSLAWGAHGFSTGIGTGERAFADTRVIRMKQSPRRSPTRRTYAAPVLHVMDVATSDRLDGLPGAARCRCRFCRAQRRLAPGQFDKALAGGHYLRRVADLAAAVATHPRGRRVAARQLVRDARRVVKQAAATVPLIGANDPKHLPLWSERLR